VWSKIWLVIITSSAPVRPKKAASSRRTVSGRSHDRAGERLVEHGARRPGPAGRPCRPAAAAAGRGGRVRRLTKACWTELKRRQASRSVSAAAMVTPAITWGLSSWAEGRNRLGGRLPAPGRARPGKSGEAKANGRPSKRRAARRRGSSRGSRPAPASPPQAPPRTRLAAGVAGAAGSASVRPTSWGKASMSPFRVRRRAWAVIWSGARRAAEAEVDPVRIEAGQGAELLGDHQRRVVGQHDPAGPDADGLSAAGDIADDHRGRGAGTRPACCGARPPSSACSPAPPRGGRGRGCCAAPRRGRALYDRRKVEHGKLGHGPNIGAKPRLAAPDFATRPCCCRPSRS